MRLHKRFALLAPILAAAALLAPPAAQASFGVKSFSASATEEDGSVDRRAGSHPYEYTLNLALNSKGTEVEGELHELTFELPPGLVGNPLVVPRCSGAAFEGGLPRCPGNSQIGVVRLVANNAEPVIPLYDMTPPLGTIARLGFSAFGDNSFTDASLRSSDYGVDAADITIPTGNNLGLRKIAVTIWGTPPEESHNAERICVEPGKSQLIEGCSSDVAPVPFLTLPATCGAPLTTTVKVTSLEEPTVAHEASVPSLDEHGQPAALTGCNSVPFNPQVAVAPTSHSAAASSGLDFQLKLPEDGLEDRFGIAETEPKKIEVALPEGVAANPSAAEGLGVCTEAQYEAETIDSPPGSGCPESSKLGSFIAHSPAIEEPLEGSLYLAKPYQNPEGTLLALYIVGRATERGVLVKQVGRVEPDPKTGRLITTFEKNLPPLPYSDFTLHFKEGARGVLVTPEGCGSYATQARLYPFSEPSTATERTAYFTIERGVNGGACSSGALPFHPGFEAGTLNNAAAAHSPLVMRLTRQDGDQDLTKISTTLPPGLLASLVGVGKCSDQDIAQARSLTGPNGGHEELEHPSCPASSQIGTTMTGAGVGGVLTYVPGNLYLAGPYNGAPLSVVAIVPGVAGPFDVGTIVVRLALHFNPLTAQAEADGSSSDPIPHILRGIPLKVRDIRVYVNRPNWTFNPTSCEPEATVGTLWGGGQNAFSTADDNPFALAARFQAADCANLAFKPNLKLNLKGGTKRGRFPALRGEYKPRPGDANLGGLVLRLPHSEFIEQGHFQTICTRVQYSAGAGFGSQCPAGSVYGWATAYTPLLEEPLEGPVRLRSSNHNLPDLVASLHGIADIEAVARIDSKDGGLRATFSDLPDAPVTKVTVSMQGGKKGLIVNSTNICLGTHRTDATYTAQSGKRAEGNPALEAKCGKAAKHRRGR